VPDEIEVLRTFRDETPGPSTDAWARARTAIAAAQAEESPAVRRRVRGPRRRRLFGVAGQRRLFPAASLVAAAAAVAVLLALLLPGSPAPRSPGQVETAAYVTHVENALASADQDNLISYARTQYPAGTYLAPASTFIQVGTKEEPGALAVSSTVRWSYQGAMKLAAYSSSGQPVFSQRIRTSAHSTETSTAVLYNSGTWWRMSLQAMDPGQGPTACRPGVQMGSSGWVGFIRTELGCGEITMDGHQRVDGVDAIKFAAKDGQLTLWVDPATYLPVRLRFDLGMSSQTDFRWLSPTVARLDQLNLAVPAHFRQVAAPS
jgi:hypothetical protein